MEKKKIYIIIGVLTIIALSLGIAFAFYQWKSSDNPTVIFTINGLDIEATNTDIEGDTLPVSDKEKGIVTNFIVRQRTTNGDVPICTDFTLTLTTLPTELQEESFKYSIYNGD